MAVFETIKSLIVVKTFLSYCEIVKNSPYFVGKYFADGIKRSSAVMGHVGPRDFCGEGVLKGVSSKIKFLESGIKIEFILNPKPALRRIFFVAPLLNPLVPLEAFRSG